jgi:uroporphyrinogen decarboxylase
MTPRQRWLATLAGEPVDRLATDYWATPEFHAALRAATGCGNDEALWRALHVDRPRWVGPRMLRKRHPDPDVDPWGLRHTTVSYGTGEYAEVSHHPLAHVTTLREADDYPWPSPDDYDYAPIAAALSGPQQRMVQGPSYEPFLLYCSLRGMEQAYADLIENPDLALNILGHLFDFYQEYNHRCFEAGGGRIDLLYLAEDLGGQHGPLFGLKTYRRFLRCNQARMAELARSHGARVFYHTDGAARAFLPDLIEVVGIDILNPIQWRCPGMELPELVRDFGRHLTFHGGIDNQQTLPFGSPDDLRREVRWVADVMREHRARWICAPCHNIQAVSPPANVIAMYEAARALAPWDAHAPAVRRR